MDENQNVHGLPLKTWAAMFRPGMHEFASTYFTFSRESSNLVRIAFGNNGPHLSENGPREPVFTHAVTLPSETAVQLAHFLLKFYGEPETDRSVSSAQL